MSYEDELAEIEKQRQADRLQEALGVGGLFEPPAPSPAAEQRRQLERVASTIADVVLAFCRAHRTFHAQELRDHVAEAELTAPASPDRVLRMLRQQGRVRYVVADRRASLYRVTWVEGDAVEPGAVG